MRTDRDSDRFTDGKTGMRTNIQFQNDSFLFTVVRILIMQDVDVWGLTTFTNAPSD